ncbi:hypothetical protein EYF80_060069 [Liparis tanakae]|uniref:Uncharacterized protein n=1 Tax=Liparis tanakae TaxID=230148 RepID=A0A4Z2EN17_9TELE|nr:hypothetical protein EYF80_060069 [Liparis tanakae]
MVSALQRSPWTASGLSGSGVLLSASCASRTATNTHADYTTTFQSLTQRGRPEVLLQTAMSTSVCRL